MIIKSEIRIIGWDDGPFRFRKKGKTVLIGVVFRGGNFFDGILKTEIDIDGFDSTEKIANAIMKSKYKDLRIVMLDGITFGGYNVADIEEIYEKTKLPVIVVNRRKPDVKSFREGMKNLPDYERRAQAVRNAGDFYYAHVGDKRVCFQKIGIDKRYAEEIIQLTAKHSLIPEPLRVAHLIASGFVLGESVGRV